MSYISLAESLEELNISEAELKKIVQEKGFQVFMMAQGDSTEKTICFKREEIEQISTSPGDSDIFDVSGEPVADLGEKVEIDLDDDDDKGAEESLDLSSDTDLDLDLDDLDGSAALDEDLDLEITEDDLDLDGADDENTLTVDEPAEDDENTLTVESSDDAGDALTIDENDADTLTLDSDNLNLDDDVNMDTLSLDEEGGADETLSFDDDLTLDDDMGAADTLTLSDDDDNNLDTEETLSFDVSDNIALPDDSFSLEGEESLTLAEDTDPEESQLMIDDDDDVAAAPARAPVTKIVEERSVGFLWPICGILCFVVLAFSASISMGLVYDMKLDRGIAFGKSFYTEVTQFARDYNLIKE
ncbi:MAG: hypothetical protein HQL32_01765 [Planctomycetes bacterium]|nr:hypothetical protein [Planctomycetota bacterium]